MCTGGLYETLDDIVQMKIRLYVENAIFDVPLKWSPRGRLWKVRIAMGKRGALLFITLVIFQKNTQTIA